MLRKWKSVFALIMVGTMILSVTGCDRSTNKAASSKSLSGQTIRFVAANHMWTNAIKTKIADYEKQTGVTVNLETYTEDQLTQKLSIEFTSGTSDMDVFMTRPIMEKKLFYQKGWYTVLGNYVKDSSKTPSDWDFNDFMPGLRQNDITDDGKLIAIPLTDEFQMLYYRTDLFKKAGLKPPTTFDELMEDAKLLNDPQNGVCGIVARGNMGTAVPVWGCFLYGYGGDFLKDGKCIANNEAGLESLKYYGKLLHDYGPQGVMNMGWPECVAIFAAGKAAMYVEGNAQMSNFTDPKTSKVVNDFGVAPFPAGPKAHKTYQTSTWGLAIAATSKHKDAAWNFITWATNKDNMKATQLTSIGMSRTSVWADKDVQATLLPGYEDVVQATAKIAVPYYAPPMIAVTQARDALGVPVVKSIESGGTGNLQSYLDTAAKQIDDLLKAENSSK